MSQSSENKRFSPDVDGDSSTSAVRCLQSRSPRSENTSQHQKSSLSLSPTKRPHGDVIGSDAFGKFSRLETFSSTSKRQPSNLPKHIANPATSNSASLKSMLVSARSGGSLVSAPTSNGTGPVTTLYNKRLGAQRSAVLYKSGRLRTKERIIRSHGITVDMTMASSDANENDDYAQLSSSPSRSPDKLSLSKATLAKDTHTDYLKKLIADKQKRDDVERQKRDEAKARAVGEYETAKAAAFKEGVDEAVFEESYMMQMTALQIKSVADASEARRFESERKKREVQAQQLIDRFKDMSKLNTCPLCNSPLSQSIRDRFGALEDRLKRSYAICREHKKETVLATARGRNYPTTFDENELERRAQQVVTEIDIQAILSGEQHSIYHERAKTVSLKYSRRLDALQQMEAGQGEMLPGYYGLHGNGVLLRVALLACDRAIRRAATKDRWISNLSVTGYVAAVVVPEMAVRLIMSDQQCDAPTAEGIRRASIAYGQVMFSVDKDTLSDDEFTEVKEKATKGKKSRKCKKAKKRDSKNGASKGRVADSYESDLATVSPPPSAAEVISSDGIERSSPPGTPLLLAIQDGKDGAEIELTPRATQPTPASEKTPKEERNMPSRECARPAKLADQTERLAFDKAEAENKIAGLHSFFAKFQRP
ncbi:RTC4-like domain-containing protein [Kockiozyma suomiensis]|uniref:RTC4-like domain-containing protein n=1 Tax=Kockiozyma suomiensis TaxID=1337062 RepID=UPI003343E8C0